MDAPNPHIDVPPALDRGDLIEAMSWAEDFERGRWGTQYATAVLDAHDARVHAVLLAENADLLGYAAVPTAQSFGAWASAMAEVRQLREKLAVSEKSLADTEERARKQRADFAVRFRSESDKAIRRRDHFDAAGNGSIANRNLVAHHDGYAYGMRAAAAIVKVMPVDPQAPAV